MTTQTISKNANNSRFDRNIPEIIEPIHYNELIN